MRDYATLPRLYCQLPVKAGEALTLGKAQSHYLARVLRKKVGDEIRVFGGEGGEYLCVIDTVQNHVVSLGVSKHIRLAQACPDIWLLFAPIKKTRTDFIVEKATELGASLIQPVLTQRTQFPKIRMDRMQSQIIEAAEQTERLDLPGVKPAIKLEALLQEWDPVRTLIFADEAGGGESAAKALAQIKAPAAILIGPEGGFTPKEREALLGHDFVKPISLGPRILRADTAALATLALWQAQCGDW